MSGWKSPPIPETPNYYSTWLWSPCTEALTANAQFINWFEVQQYVGPLQRLYVSPGTSDGYYRIITKPPTQRIIATATTHARVREYVQLVCVEILPRVNSMSHDMFHQILPSLVEPLAHQTTLQLYADWNVLEDDGMHSVDLAKVIEGIKSDSLMMSITFEYNYKYPPPKELLCATCSLPAVDPCVSPVFAGSVYCASCAAFEGGSHFLQANNLASMLDGLEVYCPFASFGCEVVLPRGKLGEHLQTCPHVRIVCVNKNEGCTFSATSKAEAIEHMQFCEYISSICQDISESQSNSNPRHSSIPLPHRLQIGDVINAANAKRTAAAAVATGAVLHAVSDKRKCTLCAAEDNTDAKVGLIRTELECAYHPGTWCGYTYLQVKEYKYIMWRQRLDRGVQVIIHVPTEIAKSTTALGVGIVSFGALVAGLVVTATSSFLPEMLLVGGFLMIIPSPVTAIVAGTIFSPALFYNLLYKLPYKLIWGTPKPKTEEDEETPKWTCCNKIGSNAEPCAKSGLHTFV